MTSPIADLEQAVQVWTPSDRGNSARELIDPYWIGPECGFLNAVQQCLTDGFPSHESDPHVGTLLNDLCVEFEPDLKSLRTVWAPENHSADSVFNQQRWEQQTDAYRTACKTQLSTDQRIRRNAVGQKLLPGQTPDNIDDAMPRFTLLAAAMALTARAALKLRWWDVSDPELPEGFQDDVCDAIGCVNAVWPVATGVLRGEGFRSGVIDPASNRRATIAMQRVASERPSSIAKSAWLSILHLLRWLTSEPSTPVDDPGTVLIQLYDPFSGQADSQPVALQAWDDSVCSCFVDIAGTGLLLPDGAMLDQLSIAAELSEVRLAARGAERGQVLALGVQFPVGRQSDQTFSASNQLRQIEGNSAGLMLALSLRAMAGGQQPDQRVTGSAALKRNDPSQRVRHWEDTAIEGVKEHSLRAKVVSAAEAGCRHFLMFEEQVTDRLDEVANINSMRLLPLGERDCESGLQQLTTNAMLADILRPLNQKILEAWESVEGDGLSGVAAGSGKAIWLRKPQPYIEPHLGWLRPGDVHSKGSIVSEDHPHTVDWTTRYNWLTEPEGTRLGITDENQSEVADAEFLRMFQLATNTRRICIAEDSNTGKSVLSKRLAAFAAGDFARREVFGGEPPLIRRWENGPLGTAWPDVSCTNSLLQELSSGLDRCPAETSATEVVGELIAQRRVLLILDSLDQACESGRQMLKLIENDETVSRAWVIVTGRSFSFSDRRVSVLFHDNRWVRFTILPFSQNQQTRFLRSDAVRWNSETRQTQIEVGPLQVDHDIESLFSDYLAIKELLGIAGMLKIVREIAVLQQVEQTRRLNLPYPDGRVPISLERLRTRCDFYLEFFHRQVLWAAEKDPGLDVDHDRERWQMMLSVTAFRMVLERATDYTIDGDLRTKVMADVDRYCSGLDETRPLESADWDRLKTFSVLSDHSILEGGSDRVLSFRHKGWMEFFAGVFLARYAEPSAMSRFRFRDIRHVLNEDERDLPGFQYVEVDQYRDSDAGQVQLFEDVLLQLTNDSQWYWMWRFAIEMPRYQPSNSRKTRSPARPVPLAMCLGLLLLQPRREIRPNELAWRAFYLFEQDERTDKELQRYRDWVPVSYRKRAVARFRKSSSAIVARIRRCTSMWDNAPIRRSWRYHWWRWRWSRQGSEIKCCTFTQCPPNTWQQDAPESTTQVFGDRWHLRAIRFRPYQIQATPVTRGQYSLFDTAFAGSAIVLDPWSSWPKTICETLNKARLSSSGRGTREDGFQSHPIVACNWYDAFMFCKWLGSEFCLPSEVQHEFAIRGGTQSDYCYGDDRLGLRLHKYAWYCGGNVNGTHPVGSLRPNNYGLFDVHGHVWEWSHDWYGDQIVPRRPTLKPDPEVYPDGYGPASGRYRVMRGGSYEYWYDSARSSRRSNAVPWERRSDYGFRVVRLLESAELLD